MTDTKQTSTPQLFPNTLLLFSSGNGPFTHDGRTTWTSHHPKRMASLPVHDVYLNSNKIYQADTNIEMGEIIIAESGEITGVINMGGYQFQLYGSFKKNKSGSDYIMCMITAPQEWYATHPKAIYQGATKPQPQPQLTEVIKPEGNVIKTGQVDGQDVEITDEDLSASTPSGDTDMTIKQSEEVTEAVSIARNHFKDQ